MQPRPRSRWQVSVRARSVATIVLVAGSLLTTHGLTFAAGASAATPLALGAAGCIESFDGLSNGNSAASLPPGVTFDEGTGASARNDGLYTAGDGTSNTGDVYSLGATAAADRAFGALQSSTLVPTLGVIVRNDTAVTLTSLSVTYTLEQWRQGATARFDQLNFSYSTTSTTVPGSYTAVPALNGVAPQGGATVSALDGNLPANRVTVSSTITGLSVAPSASMLLQWSDVNAAGADDALGIDNLTLAPNGAAAPTAACSAGGSGPTVTLISAIQGSSATSPVAGQTRSVEGIVVGLDDQIGASFGSGNSINTFPTDRGFFLQEEVADQDANPATSEGIYVGLSSSATALPAIGDKVSLTGTVRDGQNPPTFGQTRMEVSSYTVVSSGNPLPPAVTLDLTAANTQTIGVETNPTRTYYETVEGMLVTLPSGVAQSGGTNKFGEVFLVPGAATGTLLRTDPVQPGLIGTAQDAGAGNPPNPYDPPARSTTYIEVDKNDTVTGLTGPMAYSFGNYKIMAQVGQLPTVAKTGVSYPFSVPAAASTQRRIVAFNLENFFPTGGALDGHIVSQAEFEEKRDQAADAIGRLLRAPDVVAVMEIGDNQHLGQTGTTTSLGTLQALATQLGVLGYGTYTAYMLEGNDNRGIDVGYLVKSTVTVIGAADQRGGLTAAGTCSDVAGRLFDRPPLFLQVDLGPSIGSPYLVVNHFSSKAAPDSCRVAQATWVRDQARTLELAGNQVIVLGDLNAFEDEGALATLQDGQATLTNLWGTVPHDSAYSFQFNGVLQTLDHLLITDGLDGKVRDFRYAHLDNDYFQRVAQPDGHKVSDHDPPLLTLGAAAPANTGWDGVPQVVIGGGSDTSYLVSQRVERLYNGAPGCAVSTTGSCDPFAALTPTNGNFDHDVMVGAVSTGSSGGVTALTTGPQYNPAIDYARSSRGPASAAETNAATFWGYARDGVAVTTFGSRGGYALTKQNLFDIFTCNPAANGGLGADNWSDFGFPAGPIIAWDMNEASGTRAAFLTTYLGNGSTPAIPPTCLRTLSGGGGAPFENDVKPILADNGPDGVANTADDDENNFIWWQSFGNWQTYPYTTGAVPTGAVARVDTNLVTVDGIAPSNATIFNNTYPIGRTLYHVTREADADCNTVVGTEGVCTAGPTVSGSTVGGKGGAVRMFTEFLCRTSNAQHQLNPVTGRGYRTELTLAINAEGFQQVPAALRTTGYACQIFN